MLNFLLIVVIGLVVLFIGRAIGTALESQNWNNGYCYYCDSEWEHFDTDSQGGRGYTCDCGKKYGESRYIWISWHSVDKGGNKV